MNKYEFLAAVRERLDGLGKDDIDRSLDYYREMIDDRVEDGISEEKAIAALGSIDNIVADIRGEASATVGDTQKIGEKKASFESVTDAPAVSGGKRTLAVFSMIGYVIMNVIFYCTFVALSISNVLLAVGTAYSLVYSLVFIADGMWAQFLVLLGAALALAGLAVLMFIGLRYLKRLFHLLCGMILPRIRAMRAR